MNTIVAALLAIAAGVAPPSWSPPAEQLADRHRDFLEIAAPLLDREARRTFLELEESYQRDEFITAFWAALDPTPETNRNEFRDEWMARAAQARIEFGSLDDERSRVFLLQGPPGEVIEEPCRDALEPLQLWVYPHTRHGRVVAVFVDRGDSGDYRPWVVSRGPQQLSRISLKSVHASEQDLKATRHWLEAEAEAVQGNTAIPFRLENVAGVRSSGGDWLTFFYLLYRDCSHQGLLAVLLLEAVTMEEIAPAVAARLSARPDDLFGEKADWLARLKDGATDQPGAGGRLDAEVQIGFTGRRDHRIAVEVALIVNPEEASIATGPPPHSSFRINGDVLRDDGLGNDDLFESFQYQYEVPRLGGEATGDDLRLTFERLLRPGSYTLVLRLEDLESAKVYRYREPLVVPRSTETAADPEVTDTLQAARDELAARSTLRLEAPERPYQAGYTRVYAQVEGAVERVAFELDGKEILRRTRPPFTVDLDLGDIPHPRTLVAIGFGPDGEEVARDTLEINQGRYRFAVRIDQPRAGTDHHGSVVVDAEVSVPDDQELDRLELFVDDTRLAVLYQPPFRQRLTLDSDEPALVRALATLKSGGSTEDVVLINVPGASERLRIRMVELFVSALRAGQPVTDLDREDFTVLEGGEPKPLDRFEKVDDLPLHLMTLIDTSASMENRLDDARTAAHTFFSERVRPDDRVAVVTFHEQPRLRVDFTDDVARLQAGLQGLTAERGTALYDSLVFALYQFQGMKGQRALLLLTDGRDQGSGFDFDEALEYARRSGVTLYAIGLEGISGSPLAKGKLQELASASGGSTFFLDSIAELPAVYRTIEQELRSRYLLVYQSTVTEGDSTFREIAVQVNDPSVEVSTSQGYYP